ncbi:MAG: hypothetical protein QM500_21195 [Methylococcales bacterium]
MTQAEIIEDYSKLTATDIQACFSYAANREKATMLTEIIKELPTINAFKGNPLETQKVIHNKWD